MMKTKERTIVLVPFLAEHFKDDYTGALLTLGLDLRQLNSSAFNLMTAPTFEGYGLISSAVLLFKQHTGIQTQNVDWDRYDAHETLDRVVHFYTTVIDFEPHMDRLRASRLRPFPTSILLSEFDTNSGWLIPKSAESLATVAYKFVPAHLLDLEGLQGTIANAYDAARERWGH